MKEYHKIKWIYRFDEKTHLPIQELDEYFNDIKDNQWIFTEKIDWTNIRIIRDWHKPEFAGRTDNAMIPPRLLKRLQEVFMEELFEQKFWEQPVILYWEWYWGKIQKWGVYKDTEDVILFDVEINNTRLKRENVEDIANYFWVPIVPILCMWTLDEWIAHVRDWIRKDQDWLVCKWVIEWLVWTPEWWYLDRMWKRIIVKIKQDHLELNYKC